MLSQARALMDKEMSGRMSGARCTIIHAVGVTNAIIR